MLRSHFHGCKALIFTCQASQYEREVASRCNLCLLKPLYKDRLRRGLLMLLVISAGEVTECIRRGSVFAVFTLSFRDETPWQPWLALAVATS